MNGRDHAVVFGHAKELEDANDETIEEPRPPTENSEGP
jgi:hypothetical protein